MAFKEGLDRLQAAGLYRNRGITRLGAVGGVIAKNVSLYPLATITKRPGYKRFLEVQKAHPVTNVFRFDNNIIILAGDVDERNV